MSEKIAFIRPATAQDLPFFLNFAQESGPGITSLPRNPALLEKQLAQPESHLFSLEFEGRVIGSCGLVSRIGVETPFFAFHRLVETHRSSLLDVEIEVPVLHFIEARKKPTEIGTLYLQKEFRGQGFGPLLSYCRFLFIAQFREKFASTVITELRGVNHEGISPFWEAVGHHFFGLEFSEADQLRFTNPETVEELFPRHPIYSQLLPFAAQEVIGNPHPNTVPAKKMLEKQGFILSDYFDIFDGGPHLYAPTDEIHAVRTSQRATLRELRSDLTTKTRAIVATTKSEFRACVSEILIEDERITLPLTVGQTLNVDVGEEILYYQF